MPPPLHLQGRHSSHAGQLAASAPATLVMRMAMRVPRVVQELALMMALTVRARMTLLMWCRRPSHDARARVQATKRHTRPRGNGLAALPPHPMWYDWLLCWWCCLVWGPTLTNLHNLPPLSLSIFVRCKTCSSQTLTQTDCPPPPPPDSATVDAVVAIRLKLHFMTRLPPPFFFFYRRW